MGYFVITADIGARGYKRGKYPNSEIFWRSLVKFAKRYGYLSNNFPCYNYSRLFFPNKLRGFIEDRVMKITCSLEEADLFSFYDVDIEEERKNKFTRQFFGSRL